MNRIESFFKFLSEKQGKEPPLKYKILYAPETLKEKELNVMGNLTFTNNTFLYSLPRGLSVHNSLLMSNTSMEKLPDNLTVGGDLSISGTEISTIPKNLKLGQNLFLLYTPLEERYTGDEIRAEIERKGGHIKGKVFTKKNYTSFR